MLSAFLPSWLQDLSGAAATLKMIGSMSFGSMLPLLLLVPVALLALLLARRSETLNGRARRSAAFDALAKAAERRTSSQQPNAGASSPLASMELAAAAAPHETARPDEAPLVLIVDDSSVVRAKLSRVLAAAELRVAEAGDGRHALNLLQSGLKPAVLITDLEMPGMDGFELIAAVHGSSATERLPIVAITAHDDLQARIAGLGGICGIFNKPWNDQALIGRIRALTAAVGADAGAVVVV